MISLRPPTARRKNAKIGLVARRKEVWAVLEQYRHCEYRGLGLSGKLYRFVVINIFILTSKRPTSNVFADRCVARRQAARPEIDAPFDAPFDGASQLIT